MEKRIGYSFKNRSLLTTALTHSSYVNENSKRGADSYERLEFLGDSILGFVTAEHLYKTQKSVPEGELTRIRANLVCEPNLAAVAEEIGIGEFLRLGKGEEQSNGRDRPSILADVVEATIGAIYLDGGIEQASGFIHRFILSKKSVSKAARNGDYKTELQELVQRDRQSVLEYRLVGESGPDHMKLFEFEAVINGEPAGRGEGHSKKEAEQAAARAAIERLTGQRNG